MVMETTPEPSSLDAPSHRHNQDKENIGNRTPVTVSTSAIASSSLMGHPNKAPEGGDIVVADADAEMVDALSAQADAATTTTTIAPTPTTKGHQEPHVFSPELLKMYYARLFPYSFLHTWLSYDGTANSHNGSSNGSSNGNGNGTNNMASQTFTRREFSFTLEPVPGEEIYIRYQSFHNEHDLRAAIMRRQPRKIDLGAVFSHPPKDKNAHPSDGNGAFRPVQRELVFDIDLTDYDDVRNCGCSGAKICPVCWTFMQMACRVMHDGLRDDFGFRHVAWFYSGRRGIHAWVCDEEARMLSNEARSAVASYFEVRLPALSPCRYRPPACASCWGFLAGSTRRRATAAGARPIPQSIVLWATLTQSPPVARPCLLSNTDTAALIVIPVTTHHFEHDRSLSARRRARG